ncbi:hypothetical protein AA15669_2007 [Saccharibacter floricola DSM 15669]|uniref:Uncharacterized protein n=1 Tax=Saccharibacter floricola DSM 15669 TaxID=1123227 RepID=A0ABQ0P1C2_9PROT|nr:hypothetical protein AA15669_2007 [Saccharibacter floricola DSM 15669]
MNFQPWLNKAQAAIRLNLPSGNTQKRGLTASIPSDEAKALTGQKREGSAIKKRASP